MDKLFSVPDGAAFAVWEVGQLELQGVAGHNKNGRRSVPEIRPVTSRS